MLSDTNNAAQVKSRVIARQLMATREDFVSLTQNLNTTNTYTNVALVSLIVVLGVAIATYSRMKN